ncbi:hypothetical protein PCANC_14242 [Puccinia coronata f. sp. avenae]|uniref:Uncharacterized protein n=1 Tax=Puccinia coronata f. sp. avenae TaxID=200324 RepID=A0A2N5UQ77_9BASI|nr:hypothetical protein PCANC_14242 [Puccinia coronata f. sp. avenae]
MVGSKADPAILKGKEALMVAVFLETGHPEISSPLNQPELDSSPANLHVFPARPIKHDHIIINQLSDYDPERRPTI